MSNKLAKCKTCGTEIARSARACPHCGARNPTVKTSSLVAATVIIFLLSAFFLKLVGSDAAQGRNANSAASNPQLSAVEQPSVPEELQPDLYKANCTEVFNYLDLQRNPSDHTGLNLKTTVTVAQLVDGGFLDFSSYYRCYDAGDNEYVVLDARESSEPKIIKGDTITIYGEFKGVQEGTRTLTKEKVEIPTMSAKYVDFS